MTNDITKSGPRELSEDMANSLIAGIADSRASTPIVGGKPIMRLLKSGTWVYGQSDDPVQDGSEWAINPLSIKHGWVCWTDASSTRNELLGEIMTHITDKKPSMPEPIIGGNWKEQRVFDLKCLNGEDEGVEVVFKTNSVGGMRAFDIFVGELQVQVAKDRKHPVAVVVLEVTDYQHQKYGQIFNPILTIVDWLDMAGGGGGSDRNGPAVEEEKPVPPPTRPSAVPRRQRPVGRV